MNNMILTERLLLREIAENDAELIVKWRSNPDEYQFFKNPHAIDLNDHLYWYNNIYSNNPNMINWIGFREKLPVVIFGIRLVDSYEAEMSYLVDKEFRNKGLAKEAVNAIIQWTKEKFKLNIITAEIHYQNIASIGLIESLGFKVEDMQDLFIKYGLKL